MELVDMVSLLILLEYSIELSNMQVNIDSILKDSLIDLSNLPADIRPMSEEKFAEFKRSG